VAAIAFTMLGLAVSHVPPPAFDQTIEAYFAGSGIPFAVIFTRSCYWYVLVTLGAGLIALAAMSPAWRARAIFSIVLTLAGWQMSDWLKTVFGRARPSQWYAIHETTLGYPSGHAMFATIVYGLWAYFIWDSTLPGRARAPIAAALSLWALGILWSRLALGAHYPTDLAGGILLGVALVATGFAVVPVVRAKNGGNDATFVVTPSARAASK
jgi:undecaprenyl-diphosphatase